MEDHHQTAAEIKEEVLYCGSVEVDQVKTEVQDNDFVEVDSHVVHQLCTACLCATLTVHTLVDVTLKQYYMNILTETLLEAGAPVLQSPRLCWECVAHLKRSVRFREQVKDSHRLLQPLLLMCDKEDVDELLRSSVCRPGRLNTCFAHSVDIAPRDEESLVMTADHDDDDDDDDDDDGVEQSLMPVKEEATFKTEAEAHSDSTIERRCSTLQETVATIDCVKEHLDELPAICELIEETDARTRTPVEKHVKKIARFQCEVCHKSYSLKCNLIRHIRTHADKEPFQCKVCYKSFSKRKYIILHKRTHNCEKRFQCEVCYKSYINESTLVKHRRAHSGKKPFQCDICHIVFAQKGNMVAHRRTHTGEKPFQCDVCPTLFARKGDLNKHRRTHTGEKPYQCEVCHKSFANQSNVARHRRTHTGEKPFQCKICPKSFAVKSDLIRHKVTHTDVKPFQCEVCYKLFSHRYYLIRHRRTHAGEKRVSR